MSNYIDRLVHEMEKRKYEKSYIELCKQYADRLIQNSLPVIFDIKHFCLLLGIDEKYLNRLLFFVDSNYKEIEIRKKTGGVREISVPKEDLKLIQRWILRNILEHIQISPFAKGFKKDLSIKSNAEMHINKECVICLDLKDFFPTINYLQVYRVFRYYGYTRELSSIFTKLCTHNSCLPQGAPTSPYLSNIICKKLDKRLSVFSSKNNADYSRYADDITISGNTNLVNHINFVKQIINEEGYEVNNEKTRVKFKHQRQLVTGIVVNHKLSVPKELKKYLRQQIYYCKKYGVSESMEYQQIYKSHYKEYLYGIAYFIKMVENEWGKKFLSQLDEIKWDY